MSTVRRVLELDPATDARLDALAAEEGKDVATVVADAVRLLDSVVDVDLADLDEDRRRLQAFLQTGEAVPENEAKAWIKSWGGEEELPLPRPRKMR
jgi:predicted transcriptional regulator